MALAAAVLLGLTACGSRPEGARNALLITIDSLRTDHVSAHGRVNPFNASEPTTPAFDALAARGVLFENAFSTTSWTLPSHAALMTGLPDDLHGVHDNFQRLAPELVTLAQLFRDGGRRTAGFFSGPNVHPTFGFGRGFDSYVDLSQVPVDEGLFEDRELGDLRDVHLASHRTVTSPALLRGASAVLREMAATRTDFFLFVHWWDPHYDYLPPDRWRAMFVDPDYSGGITGSYSQDRNRQWTSVDVQHLRTLYDAEIRFTDDHVGELVELLEELGLAGDTVIAWTADHGEEFYEHGRWGHQRTLFEDVVRIPMAVAGPGVPKGLRVDGHARIHDLYATLAALCGLDVPDYVEARHLAPLWTQPGHGGYPVPLRLRVPRPVNPIDLSGLRIGPYKVLHDHLSNRTVVYDLAVDPGERQPIRAEEARGAHAAALERYREHRVHLERLSAGLPGRPRGVSLPPELERSLRAAGYLGD